MKRRSILKGIAGASLSTALPLSALLARTAMAAGTTRPIRTLFIYHPDGCTPSNWHPAAGTNPNLPAQTSPLSSVKQYCTFMDGFYLVGNGNTHEGGAAKVLTANDMGGGQGGSSSSIEVVLGNLSPTVFKSLQIGCLGGYWADKTISFNGTTRLPYEDNPQQAFKTLFSGGGTNTSGGNANADQLRILDNVSKDLARLRNQLGSIEKARLDQHAESFSILQNRITALGVQSGGGSTSSACSNPSINMQNLGANEARSVEKVATLSQVQQDITIQALSCDLVRNVSFMYSHAVSPIVVPGSGIGDHDASHAGGATFTTSKTWWMKEIASFITKLSKTPDGDSTLLDNTIVLLVSELGDSQLHDHWRMPFVLAGGKNTGLVGNRALDFRSANSGKGANHGELLVTIAQKAGYNLSKFGLANNPMNGIW